MTIQKERFAPSNYLKENPQVRQGLKFALFIVLMIVGYLAVKWVIDIYTFEGVIVETSTATVNGLALSMLLFLMVSGFYMIFGDYLKENPQVRQSLKFAMFIVLMIVGYLAVNWAIDIYTFEGVIVKASKATVNGLALSMLLFLMVSGFYLIFGLCDVINFAHGSFFMLGGFLGFIIYLGTEAVFLDPTMPFLVIFGGSQYIMSVVAFIVSALGAFAIMAIIGGGIEFFTIRRLYGNSIAQILLTVGFMFIIAQAAVIIWGPSQFSYFITPGATSQLDTFFMSGVLVFGDIIFETYNIFLIFLGFAVAGLMFLGFRRTRIGLQIQAGIEDSEMVEALGTDIRKLFTIVFMLGAGLAGLSGAVLVPVIGANSGHGLTYLIYAFVIVVIGGAHYGRFEGTFFGALVVGLSIQFSSYFIPDLENIIIFIIMVIILIVKPGGLTGHE